MAMFVRHLKVKLRRAKNVNACTSVIYGKSRTVVTAKVSYKNLVYRTSGVEDMGQNPVWEEDGTNVFHFDFKDESEYITLELFNRNNALIGVSKLLFSELGRLLPGKSETMTLPVMVTSHKQYGELILAAEILEQQAMGDRGLLTLKIQKGQFIQRITSVFAKTTKISAKLIYKHTEYSSGVLENMGNKFVWHEDNTFTFIINSDLKTDDILKLEVYNLQTKLVGECEMRMSLFIEQEENLRGVPSEFVAHSTDLCLPTRGAVGNVQVAASFTPKPIYRRSSFPHTQHYLPPQNPFSPPYRPECFLPGPSGTDCFPQPSAPVCFPRPSAPSPEYYPPVAGLQWSSAQPPEPYPPAEIHNLYNVTTRTHLPLSEPGQTYSPSAPVYQEVVNHHPRGSTSNYQDAVGAPAGLRQEVNQYAEIDDDLKKFMQSFH